MGYLPGLRGGFLEARPAGSLSKVMRVQRSEGFRDLPEDCPKPDAPGIGMAGYGMKEIFVKSSGIQGNRQYIEMKIRGVGTNEALRDYGDQVGLRNNMQGLHIVGHAERYSSFAAFLPKP